VRNNRRPRERDGLVVDHNDGNPVSLDGAAKKKNDRS